MVRSCGRIGPPSISLFFYWAKEKVRNWLGLAQEDVGAHAVAVETEIKEMKNEAR